MAHQRYALATLFGTFSVSLLAQAQPAERITRAIDRSVVVKLAGNRHPLARPEFDRGVVPADEPMDRMVLVLATDPESQGELDRLTAEQQNPASPLFHRWITPEEYGRRFGVAEDDLNRIAAWLTAEGFQVDEIPEGRRSLIFSGSAGKVASAFHAEIHRYLVDGEMHRANAEDPSIPAALAGVVTGIASLHDFYSQPQTALEPASAPDFTSGGSHYMAPADFATIYDVNSLYSSNIDGASASVAVVARSNIKLSDVQAFQATMGLPANAPAVILNGPDPGLLSGDQTETTLDTEWAGAVAKKAAVKVVVSKSTAASDGVTLSAQYIVNHNVAPVMTISYSGCEATAGAAYAQFWSNLWQQAAAQGITPLVSSGDSGAAGCDSPAAVTSHGVKSVNVICSSPYSMCVGGTQFNDSTNPGIYWSAASNKTTLSSALSYIPEIVWNDSGTVPGGSGLWASGGGPSIFFSRPSWQTGNGVPSDSWRHVPDVSLSASTHDGYLMYFNGGLYSAGGTSASAPTWASLMAMVNQQFGAQGNANPTLYGLYQLQTAGHTAVFHSITSGNNSVPGTPGYSAGTGYNQATGLGSPDAFALIQHWKDAAVPAPSVTTPSTGCTYVLLTPTGTGFKKTDSGDMILPGCSISINSNAAAAVSLSGSGIINANSLNVTGPAACAGSPTCGISKTGSVGFGSTKIATGVAPSADPFASAQPPAVGTCKTAVKSTGSAPVSVTPGTYCGGISITGSSSVTFAPGVYILNGGGLNLTGSGPVTGSGVTFYNTFDSSHPFALINISGSGKITLSASSGQGMLFFEDRNAPLGRTNSITGSANLNLTGNLYFKNSALSVTGSGATTSVSIVSNSLTVSGSGTFQ